MTREEAKQNTWRAHCNFDDPRKAIHIVIDQIFDYFGEQLQDKDNEIELLKHHVEEAMKPKTCDTCTYFDNELWGGDCLNFGFRCTSAGAEAHRPDDGFCCNRYKSKDS